MTDLAIAVEGMRKSYGRNLAVRNLSMHVPPGSIYGFVGPNGAGKTTTIRTLATLQKPDAGEVWVTGLNLKKDAAAIRDRVGYMPDFFGVYESLTVEEYLDFYGSSHRIAPVKRRQLCDELLELVDLTDKRRDPVEWLSRGMKQRLGLARCLIHDPEVLLLDEPASGMDPRARIELREILRELSRLRKTILISSHILPELADMCTHIGIIYGGELLAEGPVDEVIHRLSHAPRLGVRLLRAEDGEEALRLLMEDTRLEAVEMDGERAVHATFLGDESDLAEIPGRITSAGIAVTEFGLERDSLEDIFLHITEPEDAA
jgi:ABC-2 type transport system ATP-binding protein